MRHTAKHLIPLFLFSFCTFISLSAQSIEILAARETPDQVDPGSIVTKAFFVSNRGTLQEEYTSVLSVPPGWRIIALDAQPVIPLKSGDTIFATVYIPSDANPGSYELNLAIRDRKTTEEMAAFVFDVTVRERPRFDLQPLDAPDYVVAGEVYQSLYRIQNTGNVALIIDITVKSSPDLDYISEINTTELAPGGSRVFSVSVRTDQSYTKRVRHILRVTAALAGGRLESKSAASSVDILPRISGVEKPFRTLPVALAVIQSLRHAETDTYGFLARIDAEGSLSEAGDDEFSGFVKVPFDKDGALFNTESEFTLSYRKDPFDLFLGNTFFSVSPLTEDSIYGTGARADYFGDTFTLGGYHTVTAFSPPSISQSAFWYSQDLGDTTTLRFNLVDSINTVTPGSIDLLAGVEINKTGGIGPNTVFEYVSDAFHGNSSAYHLAFSDTIHKLSYSLETTRADIDFSGELKNMEEYAARISVPLQTNFAVTSDLKARHSSLDQAVPALAESMSFGMRWTITPETGMIVSYLQVEDTDLLVPRSVSTEGVRIILNHAAERIRASASAQLSRNFDRSTAAILLKELYSGTVSYDIDAMQTLKGFTSISTSRGLDSAQTLIFGVDYSVKIEDKTSLQLAYRSSSKAGSYYAGQDSVRASLFHKISDGQTAMLQGTYAPNRSLSRLTDFNLTLEYHAAIDLPIGLRKVGKIVGVVTDRETGRGVPDVIVRIGDRVAISDLSGRFLVLSLPPGSYTVGVDLSRVAESRIVFGMQPIEVNVEAGETSDVEVLLVEPGVITGTVKRFSRDLNGVVTEVGGIPDLLIEVIGEDRKIRVVTDRNGSFRVSRLIPGEWVVTIASSQLNESYYVETDRPIINLAPGEPEEIFLGVYPVIREIKMIDEGTILGNGGKETEEETPSEPGEASVDTPGDTITE